MKENTNSGSIFPLMRKLTFVILCSLFSVSAFAQKNPQKICFKNNLCVQLEIADSEPSRARGLMFRPELPEKSGMLFIFPSEGIYSFWMKNTLIPLDIIWLDKDLRVVYIKSFVPPCKSYDCPSYNPEVKARYVLEVNAGFCGFYQIKINDIAHLY